MFNPDKPRFSEMLGPGVQLSNNLKLVDKKFPDCFMAVASQRIYCLFFCVFPNFLVECYFSSLNLNKFFY